MFGSWKSRAATLAASAMLFAAPVVGFTSSPAGAAAGRGANVQRCLGSGWQSLQTSTGGTFTSQTACITYAGRGGQLFAPTLTADPASAGVPATITITGTGFHPNSAGHFTLTLFGVQIGSTTVTTDANGGFTGPVIVEGECSPQPITLTYGVSYTDAEGVHASTTFTINEGCPAP